MIHSYEVLLAESKKGDAPPYRPTHLYLPTYLPTYEDDKAEAEEDHPADGQHWQFLMGTV